MTESLLSLEERKLLENIKEYDAAPVFQRLAHILLLYDDGQMTRQIASIVQLSPSQVRRRRRQFIARGMQLFPQDELTTEETTEEESTLPPDLAIPETESQAVETVAEPPVPKMYTVKDFKEDAKSLKSPGVNRDDTLSEAGRKILRYQFAQMLLNEDGTRLGEDIEALHDMRVATRRMRAALDIYNEAFTPKAIKMLLKGLRATGRHLGKVRDRDVFIDNARQYLHTLPEEHHNDLNPLISSWEEARQGYRQNMLAFLDSKPYREFKEDLLTFVNTPGTGARPLPESLLAPNLVCEVTPKLIYTCLGDVRSFEPFLDTATLPQFHALRIAFKKFRYAIEFSQEVLGAEVKQVIADLKKIQDHLGELNDAQVASLILKDYLGEWDIQQDSLPVTERTSPESIMAYLSTVYARRQHLMSTFRDTWEYFSRPEFRQNLAACIAAL
ncbi:MAG: CHAD domain-containing protein [Anaerolineales bacterium]|nr:CHAD domain-containing protein [Anaerolineales bacterium]